MAKDFCSEIGNALNISEEEREPIFDFKNQETLDKYLKEWQERLMLTNWIINAKIVEQGKIPNYGGISDVSFSNSHAIIQIAEYNHNNNYFFKQPQELVLVHELLHCVFMNVVNENTIEGLYYSEKQHQTLERIAKSLIMAKYNLIYDWFKA